MCHLPDDRVELMVGQPSRGCVALFRVLCKLSLSTLQIAQLRRSAVLCRQIADVCVDKRGCLEKRSHHADIHRRNLCAAIFSHHNITPTRQTLQNFAQRCARNPQWDASVASSNATPGTRSSARIRNLRSAWQLSFAVRDIFRCGYLYTSCTQVSGKPYQERPPGPICHRFSNSSLHKSS